MKKLLIALFCIFTAGMAFGQEEGGRMGKMFIQPNFSYGFTYVGGEVTVQAGVAEPVMEPNIANAFGLNFGYFTSDTGAFIFGLAKESKILTVSSEDDNHYKLDCITLQAGYRGYNGGFFWGVGLFYSSISSDSDWDIENDNGTTTVKLGDYYDVSAEIGLYFEVGGSIQMAETVYLDLGVKFEGAINNSIKLKSTVADPGEKVEIRSRALMLNAGVTILFN